MTRGALRLAALAALAAVSASACGQLQTISTEQALRRLEVASTKIYAADGSLIANLHGEVDRDVVRLRDIPRHVRDAVVAVEDERFYDHRGVDLRSIARAFVSNLRSRPDPEVVLVRGGEGWCLRRLGSELGCYETEAAARRAWPRRLEGGSTLSQQLVKTLYFSKIGESADCLQQDAETGRIDYSACQPPRTLARKLAELRVTVSFEQQYSKDRILEMYLNTVYFGRGTYGVQAAARSYFHKDASRLTVAEGAFLAGLIHEPARYEWSPRDPPERRRARQRLALQRRDLVLEKMRRLGFIDEATYRKALSERTEVFPPEDEEWRFPYFVDFVLRQLGVLRNPLGRLDPRFAFLGSTFAERARNVYRGGLRIYTTLDPAMQAAAEEAVARQLPNQGALGRLQAAVVALEPSSGYVRALVGGRDYYATERAGARVNLALGRFGGGLGRQPGSSFKPFVLAAALERGISLNRTFDSSEYSVPIPGSAPWKVRNYEGTGGGTMTVVEATVDSVNAAYARLEVDGVGEGNPLEGAARVADVARRLGIPFPTPEELRERCGGDYLRTDACQPADLTPAIALGAKEVSPLDMAAAYAAFAAEGMRVEPTAILRIEDMNGKVVFSASPRRERALPRAVALGVTAVLQQVIQRGTGVRARLGRPAAGKTGTAQEWRDAWFVGYVPQLVAAVWVGNPLRQESMHPRNGYPFRVVGGSFPALIWQYFMTKALAQVPVEGFAEPPPEFFVPQQAPRPPAQVPDVLGLPVAEAVAQLEAAGLKPVLEQCLARGAPPGVVVRQAPAGGVELPRGSEVRVCSSIGELPFLFGPTPTPFRFGRGEQASAGSVPGVVGMSRARASATLRDAGYRMNDVPACDPSGQSRAGEVWSQSPGPGTPAPRGSTVTVWYQRATCD